MKINFKKLHVQIKYWKPHGGNSLCWGFFGVNDNAKVDLENTQIMCYIFCYQNHVIGINPITQVRKILIFYYKTNGINSFRKYVYTKYTFIA
jgi:hypothetical protein